MILYIDHDAIYKPPRPNRVSVDTQQFLQDAAEFLKAYPEMVTVKDKGHYMPTAAPSAAKKPSPEEEGWDIGWSG